jgi:UDP-glucose 4-epimerase
MSQYAAVVPRFVAAIAKGEPVEIYGDGTQSRDFTYVANVIEANILAADAPGVAGATINVGTGTGTTVNQLAETVGAVLQRPVDKQYLSARLGDVPHSYADISLASALLGYEPTYDLEDGLARTIRALGEPSRAPSGS